MVLRGKFLQYYVFCAGSFNVLLSGLHLGWPSASLPILLGNNSTIPLTNNEGSWVASIFLIGGIFGAVLSALILDVIGRKKMLLATSLPFLLTWLMTALARSVVELYVARFIAGILDGLMFCSFPLFLAEISDSKIRGFLISGISLVYFIANFLANILGSFFSISAVAFQCSALSVGGIVLNFFIPESPYFYMMKGDVPNAKISMQKFTGRDNVDDLLSSIADGLKKEKKKEGNLLQIFTDPSNRKSFCLVAFMRTFQQCTGFTALVFYVLTLFEEAQEDVSPVVLVSVYYVLQIIVMILNAVVIDRIGRRPLLIVSMSMVIVALSIVSVYFSLENISQIDVTDYSWLPVFGLLLFVVGHTIGLNNIPILLVGELFPMHVKSYASSILDIVYGLEATAVSKFFQYTKDEFGTHLPFIVFTICSICGLPFIIFCIPETKRRTLEEIQDQLRSKQKPNKDAI